MNGLASKRTQALSLHCIALFCHVCVANPVTAQTLFNAGWKAITAAFDEVRDPVLVIAGITDPNNGPAIQQKE